MDAKKILRGMGANGLYVGYENMLECVDLLIANPYKLLSLQKDVYAVVAKKNGLTVSCMKRRLDILMEVIWKSATTEQWQILGLSPFEKPTVGEYLEAIVWFLQTVEEIEKGYPRKNKNNGYLTVFNSR